MDGVLPAEPSTFQQIYHEADRLYHRTWSSKIIKSLE